MCIRDSSNGNPIEDAIDMFEKLREQVEGKNATLEVLGVGDVYKRQALGSGNVDVDINQYTYQQTTRPYFNKFPNYAVINQVESEANSNYNSLQALIRTTNWHHVTTQMTYTCLLYTSRCV